MQSSRLPRCSFVFLAAAHAGRRYLLALVVLALITTTPAAAQASATTVPSMNDLTGEWSVDLRPTPGAPAYLKTMRLLISAEQVVSGSFYDSEITKGRADAKKGRACFAFTTSDGLAPYQTSGCLAGDRIEGQTWSEGRGFLLTWTAVRPAKQPA